MEYKPGELVHPCSVNEAAQAIGNGITSPGIQLGACSLDMHSAIVC